MIQRITAAFIFYIFIFSSVFAQDVSEFRAVKITNVDSDVLFSDANIAEAMDYLASIGINVILPVVWNGSGADGVYSIYPSAVMDSMFGQKMHPGFDQQRDPLGRLIIEAHRNGMEVIPWFEMGFSPSYSQNGGHILEQYPEWALKNTDGELVVKNGFDWMSAVNPEVQAFITALIVEVVQTYDVDGIELSDRIPAMPVEGGYDSVTVAIYQDEHNGQSPPQDYQDPGWMEWRADKLTDWFAHVRDTVKSYGEHLLVSSSPSIYPWGYNEYLQDSQEWVETGVIDNLIPQLYRYNFSDYQYELNSALGYLPSGWRDKFFSGMLIKVGSYTISPEFLLQSIQANRQHNVQGEALFFYEGLRDDNNLLGDTLASTVYATHAFNPHRNSTTWRPLPWITNEEDALSIGSWTTSQINGYTGGIQYATAGTPASLTYDFHVPASGWYGVYAYLVTGGALTDEARYTIYSEGDSVSVILDQQNSYNAGWQHLETVYLEDGNQQVLKIDNSLLTGSEKIVVDAAMLMLNRKYSPDVVITNISEPQDSAIPKDFTLFQNYPNPFNGNTKISYSIPVGGMVNIQIFNIRGETIHSIQKYYQSGGNYTLTFSEKTLVSGLYFYRLEYSSDRPGSGIMRKTGKMTLLK